jgi:hypothetical protein
MVLEERGVYLQETNSKGHFEKWSDNSAVGIAAIERWFGRKTIPERCSLVMIPAFLILFGKLWKIEEMNVFMKVITSIFAPILAMVISLLFFAVSYIAIARNDISDKVMGALFTCSVCVAYAFTAFVACGYWFAEDRSDRRDQLVDRAEQHLIENGIRVTVQTLKVAMRQLENDSSGY